MSTSPLIALLATSLYRKPPKIDIAITGRFASKSVIASVSGSNWIHEIKHDG